MRFGVLAARLVRLTLGSYCRQCRHHRSLELRVRRCQHRRRRDLVYACRGREPVEQPLLLRCGQASCILLLVGLLCSHAEPRACLAQIGSPLRPFTEKEVLDLAVPPGIRRGVEEKSVQSCRYRGVTRLGGSLVERTIDLKQITQRRHSASSAPFAQLAY